ncbi:MAG: hypothetical protein ACRD5E_07355 [Nitrososphaeraceae archaeon]
MKTSSTSLVTIPALILLVPNIYASGIRSDWSDFYDNVEGASKCWQDGYNDGLDYQFDQDRHKECQFDIEEYPDFGEPYYEAFMHGCRRAGNTEQTCERFTDQ